MNARVVVSYTAVTLSLWCGSEVLAQCNGGGGQRGGGAGGIPTQNALLANQLGGFGQSGNQPSFQLAQQFYQQQQLQRAYLQLALQQQALQRAQLQEARRQRRLALASARRERQRADATESKAGQTPVLAALNR
jgi:hypothetical protein